MSYGVRAYLEVAVTSIVLALCCGMSARSAEQTDPLKAAREHLAWERYEQAIASVEKLRVAGACKGAGCDACVAIARAKLKLPGGGMEEASAAVAKLDAEPAITANEANELGVILFRRAGGNTRLLAEAEKMFRFALKEYRGRASNIRFNLATTLEKLGRVAEAADIQKGLSESGLLIDPHMAILGDFQSVGSRVTPNS